MLMDTKLKGGTGKKFDTGKPPISLISKSAIVEEARVMGYGAKKYGRYNYLGGMQWSRLIDAAFRHLLCIADGQDVDVESGLLHAAHVRCCMGMLIEFMTKELGEDDRFKCQDKGDNE